MAEETNFESLYLEAQQKHQEALDKKLDDLLTICSAHGERLAVLEREVEAHMQVPKPAMFAGVPVKDAVIYAVIGNLMGINIFQFLM